MAENSSNSLVDTLEDFFKKAPALPANFKEGLVRFAPVLTLVFGIIGILIGLVAAGITTAFAPLALIFGVQGYGSGIIAGWTLLIMSALLLAAYPGTKARKFSGWNLLFWSVVVNAVGNLISLNILGALVGGLIGLYLLFQIKSYYK